MLIISTTTYARICDQLQAAYPNEGAGLILGTLDGALPDLEKTVQAILPSPNRSEAGEQHHRYLIAARDILDAENKAEELGLDVVGVFHSHPDHPAEPSAFDREFALPWYSYLIVSMHKGSPADARAWVLADDRSRFVEEKLVIA